MVDEVIYVAEARAFPNNIKSNPYGSNNYYANPDAKRLLTSSQYANIQMVGYRNNAFENYFALFDQNVPNNGLYTFAIEDARSHFRAQGIEHFQVESASLLANVVMRDNGPDSQWSSTSMRGCPNEVHVILAIYKDSTFDDILDFDGAIIRAEDTSTHTLYLSGLDNFNQSKLYLGITFTIQGETSGIYQNYCPHLEVSEFVLSVKCTGIEPPPCNLDEANIRIVTEPIDRYLKYPVRDVSVEALGVQCAPDPTCGSVDTTYLVKYNQKRYLSGYGTSFKCDILNPGDYECSFTFSGCNTKDPPSTHTIYINLADPVYSLDINGKPVGGNTVYVSSKNGVSIPITYRNTYGEAFPLFIKIDDDTHTSRESKGEYTYNFVPSKSGIYNIRCGYNDVIDYNITLIVTGVLTGHPELYINDIHTNFWYRDGNVPINVPAYYQIQCYLTGIDGIDAGTRITIESNNKSQDNILSVVQDTYNPTVFTITLKIKPTKSDALVYFNIDNEWFEDYSSSIIGVLQVISRIDIDRHQGEVGSECIFNCIGTSIIPLEDGTSIEGDYQWGIINLSGQEITDYVITKGSKTSKEFSFYMTKAGVYDVVLKSYSKTYIKYTPTITKERITVSNIIDCSLPTQDRFAVILINKYNCVTIRRRNSSLLFNNLEFTSALNAIGKSKFNLYISDISANIPSNLLANNVNIVIVDGLTPVWSGTVDMIEEVNINTYDKVTFAKVYDIEASESTLQLSYEFMNNKDKGTVTGTVDELVSRILPSDWIGSVSKSKAAYTVSLDSTSRLQALETLTSQIGWKYRCRPDCPSYLMRIKVENRTYQVISGTAPQENDLVILYSGTMDTSGNLGIGLYYSFIADGSGNIRYTADTIPSDTYYGSVYHGFLIDYKPSYYQNYSPLSVTVNEYAQNVSAMATSRDKYTEVSVYGVGYSGENLSSDIRLWMKINKDYTIDNAMYIVTSYDSSVSAINTLDNAIVNRYIWARYQITLTGWSFPLEPLANHKPTVFYRTSNGRTRKLELTSETGRIIPQRYQDQSKTAQTSIIVACIISKDDGSPLSPNDVNYKYYKDQDGRLLTDIIASFNPETNVCFNLCKLDNIPIKTDGTTLVKKGEYLLIGDTRVTVTDVYTNGWITFDWIYPEDTMYPYSYGKSPEHTVENRNPIPHGHLAGVLVMRDDSDILHQENAFTQYHPDPQSPMKKYNDMKITIQGAEGYSPMELERHACRIAQYGSNYDAQGSADIVYNVFRKSDYDVGCKKILTVGDRLTFNVATFRRLNVRGYDVRDFELIEYKVNCTQNRVSVNFGMPFVEVNDILYNMLSTSGMSVLPSTTEHVDEMFILHD